MQGCCIPRVDAWTCQPDPRVWDTGPAGLLALLAWHSGQHRCWQAPLATSMLHTQAHSPLSAAIRLQITCTWARASTGESTDVLNSCRCCCWAGGMASDLPPAVCASAAALIKACATQLLRHMWASPHIRHPVMAMHIPLLAPQPTCPPGRCSNFNCVVLDCGPVRIGDRVLLGPNVQLYSGACLLGVAAGSTLHVMSKLVHACLLRGLPCFVCLPKSAAMTQAC